MVKKVSEGTVSSVKKPQWHKIASNVDLSPKGDID